MPNLQLATPLLTQVIVRGENHFVSIHVHEDGGNNFNWSGYTPKAKISVGLSNLTCTGSVISQAGGTASFTFTAAQTGGIASASWGELVMWADPTVGGEDLHIATVPVQFTAEAIP